MSADAIRAAIFTVVAAVDDIGHAYDYGRWTAEWDTFIERFRIEIGGVSQIRAWMVEYAGAPLADVHAMGPGRGGILRTHDFRIRGVLGLDDSAESEKTMSALAETVANALDDADGLDAFYNADPARITVFELRRFGSAMCHYAEIMQRIVEYRSD